jgi:hypothetical protein
VVAVRQYAAARLAGNMIARSLKEQVHPAVYETAQTTAPTTAPMMAAMWRKPREASFAVRTTAGKRCALPDYWKKICYQE